MVRTACGRGVQTPRGILSPHVTTGASVEMGVGWWGEQWGLLENGKTVTRPSEQAWWLYAGTGAMA